MIAPDQRPRPLAIFGAPVWTGSRGERAEAVAFAADGSVLAVGSADSVRAALPAETLTLDAAGLTVVPGFVDAHTHVRAAAARFLWPDCGDARDAGELLERAAEAVRQAEPGATVSLAGMEPRALAELPSRAQLDLIAPDQPLRIRDRSLHAWLLNSAAAEVVAGTLGQYPADGLVFDRDGEVRRAFGRVSGEKEIERAVAQWSARRLRDGVTALLDAGAGNTAADLETLARWHRDGVLAQHPVAFLGERAAPPAPPPALTVAGTKLIFAAEPRSVAAARRRILAAWRRHPVAAVHCADTEALGDVLDAVAGIPRGQRRRLRIEHAALAPPEWIDRLAALDAGVVTQPGFVREHGDRYRVEVALPLQEWLYRQRSWVEAGVPFAAGSDEPAGGGRPLEIWEAAVHRRTASGVPLAAAEALSPAQALTALTASAADLCGMAGYGRLLPGSRGGAVLLSGDPLAGEFADAEVVATVFGGRLVGGCERASMGGSPFQPSNCLVGSLS